MSRGSRIAFTHRKPTDRLGFGIHFAFGFTITAALTVQFLKSDGIQRRISSMVVSAVTIARSSSLNSDHLVLNILLQKITESEEKVGGFSAFSSISHPLQIAQHHRLGNLHHADRLSGVRRSDDH